MDPGPNQKENSSFKIFFHIGIGCPKVLTGQEALAVCIVLETTWCLVWDSQWEGKNISAGRPPSFMFLEASALFQSESESSS